MTSQEVRRSIHWLIAHQMMSRALRSALENMARDLRNRETCYSPVMCRMVKQGYAELAAVIDDV